MYGSSYMAKFINEKRQFFGKKIVKKAMPRDLCEGQVQFSLLKQIFHPRTII